MYPWELLHILFGQQLDRYYFTVPYSRLVPTFYVSGEMYDPQNLVWGNVFAIAERILTEDDLAETTAYLYENQYYMCKGSIPEFTINIKLKSLDELDQFLMNELSCFTRLFGQLTKLGLFDTKSDQLPTVDVKESIKFHYLYQFQPKSEKYYYNWYLRLASQHTQDEQSCITFATEWSQRRHKALSTYSGYYIYLQTTYSIEGSLYAVEQILCDPCTTETLPELMYRFQHEVEIAKNLIWDNEHYLYIENVINNYIYHHYLNNSSLHAKALEEILVDFSRNAWRKIRSCKNKDRFRSFIYKITKNKINDLWREMSGRVRLPRWLINKEKEDPIYSAAYEVLVKSSHSKQEAFSILHIRYPEKEKLFIQNVIDAVLIHCPRTEFVPKTTDSENDEDEYQTDDCIETQFTKQYIEEILDQLNSVLLKNEPINQSELHDLIVYLESCANLTPEDKILLNMKFTSGLTDTFISSALNISKMVVKYRFNNILEKLKKCLRHYFD